MTIYNVKISLLGRAVPIYELWKDIDTINGYAAYDGSEYREEKIAKSFKSIKDAEDYAIGYEPDEPYPEGILTRKEKRVKSYGTTDNGVTYYYTYRRYFYEDDIFPLNNYNNEVGFIVSEYCEVDIIPMELE